MADATMVAEWALVMVLPLMVTMPPNTPDSLMSVPLMNTESGVLEANASIVLTLDTVLALIDRSASLNAPPAEASIVPALVTEVASNVPVASLPEFAPSVIVADAALLIVPPLRLRLPFNPEIVLEFVTLPTAKKVPESAQTRL